MFSGNCRGSQLELLTNASKNNIYGKLNVITCDLIVNLRLKSLADIEYWTALCNESEYFSYMSFSMLVISVIQFMYIFTRKNTNELVSLN